MPCITVETEVDIDLDVIIDQVSDDDLERAGLQRTATAAPGRGNNHGAISEHEALKAELQRAFRFGSAEDVDAAARAFFEATTGELAWPRAARLVAVS